MFSVEQPLPIPSCSNLMQLGWHISLPKSLILVPTRRRFCHHLYKMEEFLTAARPC